MARRGRPAKSQLEQDIRLTLRHMSDYCDPGFWMSEISYLQENGSYEQPPANEFEKILRELETGDYEICNCFLAARQLVYLLAEKEGVIPKFSNVIGDDEGLYSIKEATSDNGPYYCRKVEDLAFRSAMQKYGFSFPDGLNWSGDEQDKGEINDQWSNLRPEVLKKLAENREFMDGQASEMLSDMIERGAEPEEIERFMNNSSQQFDSMLCLVSEKIISYIARYNKLPKVIREKISDKANELIEAHDRVSTNACEVGFLSNEGDNITLDNGVTVYVNYMQGYWDGDGYGYYSNNYIHAPALESFEADTIFLMEKAHNVAKKFVHVLVDAEKKAKKYRHMLKVRKERRLMKLYAKKLGFDIAKKPSEKVS